MAGPRQARPYHAARFRPSGRPLVLGHRGASAGAPENTAEAFALAREQGADGVECDVMACGTGELVVCHDERLERLCGVGLRVGAAPLAALRELPVLRERFPHLRAVTPTLEEAVEAGGPELLWNVELKVDRHEDAAPLAALAAKELGRLPLAGRVLVSSFHPLALLALRKLAPELPTALLWEGGPRELYRALVAPLVATAALHPAHEVATAARIRRFHEQGYLVNVWTVDEPETIRRLAGDGADGIITNVPGRALEALQGT